MFYRVPVVGIGFLTNGKFIHVAGIDSPGLASRISSNP